MKVRIMEYEGDAFGVQLIAESKRDREIIKRFDLGGIKNNGVTNVDQKIQLTFADLIGK